MPPDASLEESLAHARSVLDGLKEGRRAGEGDGLLARAQAIDALGLAHRSWMSERRESEENPSIFFIPESLWDWLGKGVRCTQSHWTEAEHGAHGRHTRKVMAEAAETGLVDQALSLLVDGHRVEPMAEEFPQFASVSRSLRTLLKAEAIDRYQRGEPEAGARAHAALVELATHLVLYGDPLSDLLAAGQFVDASRLVWEAIEREVISGEAAEALLRSFEVEPDWAAMRRDLLAWQVEIVEAAQKTVGVFGDDGVVRPDLAARAPAEFSIGVVGMGITLPELRDGERYATVAEVVVSKEAWAAALADEAAKPRAARDPERFDLALDAGAGVRVPGGFRWQSSVIDHHFAYFDDAEFSIGAARLALAIEVHRHRHGRLPERLEELVPGVLAALPRDPWAPDGRYRYRLTDASHLGYVLYGVGLNGEDNGGRQTEPCLDVPSHLKWDGAADCVVLPRRRMGVER
ncbi:MAG: hypothetical protein JJU33_12035 [Phycisphaerales bacterium]|nr:hypothetical protein [Phycisphaerales bacterium]